MLYKSDEAIVASHDPDPAERRAFDDEVHEALSGVRADIIKATDKLDAIADRIKAETGEHKHLWPLIDFLSVAADLVSDAAVDSTNPAPAMIEALLPGRWKDLEREAA